ncbi:MAG: histidine--tRNA ligase, partial [Clostridia bacterium]|nr:histidine--tRNA ligase [Clostridia bacterium]
GFATGIERLMMVMQNSGVEIENKNNVTVYFAPMGAVEAKKCFELVCKLRKQGYICDTDYMGKSIKAQFKYADKINAKYVAVIGSSELEAGKVKIKRMSDGFETLMSFDKIESFLQQEKI